MSHRFTFALVLIAVPVALAGDWPQFRGPAGAGVSDETGLPTNWSDKDGVKWKAEIPGRSVSSPVVFGKKVFVCSATGVRMDRLHALCLDADTGKVLWHRQFSATGNTACHEKSSMAAPTPCVNADGVYFLFATADLAALDLEGNLKWYRSLVSDYPDISNQVGMASSPILWKDFLIVPMDTTGDSFLSAVDTKYGMNVWKVARPKEINWVTPTLRNANDKTEIIFSSPKETMAYDAADGKKTWTYASGGGSVPLAVLAGENVLLPVGAGLACLKPDAMGMSKVWESPKLASSYPSPLVYKDRVYAIGRAGTVLCADVKTGKDLWSERIGKGKGAFWASPIAGDGKIYAFDDAGICTVLKAGDTVKVIGSNDMKAEIMGTPAIANGSLFIPTTNGLYCISK